MNTIIKSTLIGALCIGAFSNAGLADGGRALTWVSKQYQYGAQSSDDWVVVGSNAASNPYTGNAGPKEILPVLCIIGDEPNIPEPAAYRNVFNGNFNAFYHGWSGRLVGITKPVQVGSITSKAVGDKLCVTQLEDGAARMASHHDNLVGGHNFGGRVHPLTYEDPNISLRNICSELGFVTHIGDQTANPWDP